MIENPQKVYLSNDYLHTYLKTASKAPENTAGGALTNPTDKGIDKGNEALERAGSTGPKGPKGRLPMGAVVGPDRPLSP